MITSKFHISNGVNRPVIDKVSEVVSVKDFGAVGDGITDDTARIQLALNSVNGVVHFGSASYKIASTVYVDISRVAMQGEGAKFIIAGLPAGTPAFIFASSGAAGSSGVQSLGGFCNFIIVGDNTVGQVACQFGIEADSHGLLASVPAANTTLINVAFVNVDICDKYASQGFDIKHIACEYESCGHGTAMIVTQGSNNYGENLTYTACTYHNGGTVLNQTYVASQFNFSQCTFDYCNQYFNVSAGWCIADSCYFEHNQDVASHFVTSSGGLLILNSPMISQTGNRVNTDIFTSAGAAGTGFFKPQLTRNGIHLKGGTVNFNNVVNRKFLCGGAGPFFYSDVAFVGYALSHISNPVNTISSFSNRLSNGSFDANITGWTTAGSVSWNSTGGNPGGSLKLVYDQEGSAFIDFICSAGDTAVVTFDIALTGLTSRYLNVFIQPMDVLGTALGTSSYSGSVGADVFTGSSSYVTSQTRFCNLPAGTAKARLTFSLAGGPVGAGLVVNIDNVIVNIA